MPLVLDYVCKSCYEPMPKKWASMMCKCGGFYSTSVAMQHHTYFDEALGANIYSQRQKAKLMKKQRVVDCMDFKSKNPLVLEAKEKWKWKKNRGLV